MFFLLGLVAAFAFSFLGFGLLWIGLPFPVQCGLSIPFAALAVVLARQLQNGTSAAAAIFVGAGPIGSMITLFRDKNDSHLLPILVVVSWAMGAALGIWWGRGRA